MYFNFHKVSYLLFVCNIGLDLQEARGVCFPSSCSPAEILVATQARVEIFKFVVDVR